MPASFWPSKREGLQNRQPDFVAAPAVYKVTIADGEVAQFSFNAFTRQIAIVADGDVLFGLTKTGVAADNSFPIGPTYPPFNVFMQVRNFYVANESGGSRVVNVLVVQGDVAVSSQFGDMDSDHGFDGGDSSDAVTNPA